jgi:transposase
LGNPTKLYLTEGQVHDLAGSDEFLKEFRADALLADRAYDADERVLKPLAEKGKEVVIPPKKNRRVQRHYDRALYKARHLVENFFAKLKQYRAIATRYDKLANTFMGAVFMASIVICLN